MKRPVSVLIFIMLPLGSLISLRFLTAPILYPLPVFLATATPSILRRHRASLMRFYDHAVTESRGRDSQEEDAPGALGQRSGA